MLNLCAQKSDFQDGNLEKVCIFSGEGATVRTSKYHFEKSIVDNQMNIYNGENLKNKGIFSCVKKALFRDGHESLCVTIVLISDVDSLWHAKFLENFYLHNDHSLRGERYLE